MKTKNQWQLKYKKIDITTESNLMYDRKYSFSKYRNVTKSYDISLNSKYLKFFSFLYRLNRFRNLTRQTEKKQN